MKGRIFRLSFLLAAAAALAACALTMFFGLNSYFNAVKAGAASDARHIGAGIEMAGPDYLGRVSVKSAPPRRVTWIGADGAVLYESDGDAAFAPNHLDRPEVAGAMASGVGESVRRSDTIQGWAYYYAVRLADGSALRVAAPLFGMLKSFMVYSLLVATLLLALMACAGAVSSVVTRRIVEPLTSLDLDSIGEQGPYDEISPLLRRIRSQKRQIADQLASLERQRADFAAITRNMSEGFIAMDAGGVVLAHNPSALRLLDSPTANATGQHIYTVSRGRELRSAVEGAMAGQDAEAVLEVLGRKVLVSARPVVEGGQRRGVTLILMDATERLERERLRREFASNVSHELKTPLTVLSGSAELMMGGMVEPGGTRRFGEAMYKEAQRMTALVNDLLFLSRLDEGTALDFEDVDLLALARGAAERFAGKAAERGVTITATGNPTVIRGARSVLDAMVCNLTDNAVKYNVEGGRVTIAVTRERGMAALAVEDTGIGIPKEEQERIFERFYRVDKGRGNAIPGTGLGLAIVKHAAMVHGAKLEVASGGWGTRVSVGFGG
ncbi:MAG: PAS domain-containing protein [Oscillospiraceae bacterium]|jgi:two-component system phosphate regulon sensor histidine kinase PhoR|nr:PAS domain-containing protein [Oscillospiraceae bacterium]